MTDPLPNAEIHTLEHAQNTRSIRTVEKMTPCDVYFYDDRIKTVVTHDPSQVSLWLSHTQKIHRRHLNRLIVGLDVEWLPNTSKYEENPVATLQLCVGRCCLIFQILCCSELYGPDNDKDEDFIPDTLRDFLGNQEYTYVGVRIQSDVEKLEKDYGLKVGGRIVDLSQLAADEYNTEELRTYGMNRLAKLVLGKEVEKHTPVRWSRWNNQRLTPDQVQYACIDAFVSFEIGRRLNASKSNGVPVSKSSSTTPLPSSNSESAAIASSSKSSAVLNASTSNGVPILTSTSKIRSPSSNSESTAVASPSKSSAVLNASTWNGVPVLTNTSKTQSPSSNFESAAISYTTLNALTWNHAPLLTNASKTQSSSSNSKWTDIGSPFKSSAVLKASMSNGVPFLTSTSKTLSPSSNSESAAIASSTATSAMIFAISLVMTILFLSFFGHDD